MGVFAVADEFCSQLYIFYKHVDDTCIWDEIRSQLHIACNHLNDTFTGKIAGLKGSRGGINRAV